MSDVPKYWIYVHDENGNFVDDGYVKEDFAEAIAVAAGFLGSEDWNTKHSVHIVDQHADSESVWIAGSCTVKGEA